MNVCKFGVMKKIGLTFAIILSAASVCSVANACDIHSGSFNGFGFGASAWKTYNPQVSKTDPALAKKEAGPINSSRPAKYKPSFSNAANVAASKAKAQWAKNQRLRTPIHGLEFKKPALNAAR